MEEKELMNNSSVKVIVANSFTRFTHLLLHCTTLLNFIQLKPQPKEAPRCRCNKKFHSYAAVVSYHQLSSSLFSSYSFAAAAAVVHS